MEDLVSGTSLPVVDGSVSVAPHTVVVLSDAESLRLGVADGRVLLGDAAVAGDRVESFTPAAADGTLVIGWPTTPPCWCARAAPPVVGSRPPVWRPRVRSRSADVQLP